MNYFLPLMTISGAVTFVGGVMLAYNIYQMTIIDAEARGIQKPKAWGLLNAAGNNGNAFILLYLIRRRQFPVKSLPKDKKIALNLYKKKALVAMGFHLIAGLVFAICLINYTN